MKNGESENNEAIFLENIVCYASTFIVISQGQEIPLPSQVIAFS